MGNFEPKRFIVAQRLLGTKEYFQGFLNVQQKLKE